MPTLSLEVSERKSASVVRETNLNGNSSTVTVATNLRNADDENDKHPIMDHREIGGVFNDSMSLKNE